MIKYYTTSKGDIIRIKSIVAIYKKNYIPYDNQETEFTYVLELNTKTILIWDGCTEKAIPVDVKNLQEILTDMNTKDF